MELIRKVDLGGTAISENSDIIVLTAIDPDVKLEEILGERHPGSRRKYFDKSLDKYRLTIQLDDAGIWFLSVFVKSDGAFEKFSLDQESASDSHYEFTDEQGLRRKIYCPGDESKTLSEVLIRYVKEYGGYSLASALTPFVTAEYHFD